MSEMLPTDAWGSILSVELTETEQTFYDDGFDAGYEAGWKEAMLQAITTLLPLVDPIDEEMVDA